MKFFGMGIPELIIMSVVCLPFLVAGVVICVLVVRSLIRKPRTDRTASPEPPCQLNGEDESNVN